VQWISSLGGPLIFLPESHVTLWRGAFGPEGEEDWPEEETDYGRAGEVEDFVGTIPVGDAEALVLANEPVPTTYDPARMLIVQRMAITTQPDVLSVVERIWPSIEWRSVLNWSVIKSPLVLFDSAFPGEEIERAQLLRADVPPGRYDVRVSYFEPRPDADVWVTLVHLVPLAADAPG
jgi:hypothetical protein